MRNKYFLKLLSSHVLILILAFLLMGLIFSQFVRSYIFENKVEELNEYGQQILEDVSIHEESPQTF